MKFNSDEQLTMGAKRTLLILRASMARLLKKKNFNSIKTSELCAESLIPKSTFYNYFEDKYDFLDYFIEFTLMEIGKEIDSRLSYGNQVKDYLTSMFKVLNNYREYILKIMEKNPKEDYLCRRFGELFIDMVVKATVNMGVYTESNVPVNIIARMNATAILTVMMWSLIDGTCTDPETLVEYSFILFQK